jgi:peptidoglycan/xylan/chitin deacetylase (PgdA/CDA1 family)
VSALSDLFQALILQALCACKISSLSPYCASGAPPVRHSHKWDAPEKSPSQNGECDDVTMQFAPLYPLLYRVLPPLFPACLWSGDRHQPTIALTIDDGPHPQHTPQLLKVLERYNVTANFFWLGLLVEQFPHVARQVYAQEHWLGLHGYEHRMFPRLGRDALQRSLERTQRVIAQACDLDWQSVQQQIRDVRPPLGVVTPQTVKDLTTWHYRPVMWSVVPEDWVCPGIEVVVQRILRQVTNGSLIVLHDGYYGGEDVAAIAALVIPQLLEQGYRFVTVEEMWQSQALNHPV